MNAREIIERKRNGTALTRKEIAFFLKHYMAGEITDYQTAALLMAIFFRGMNTDETLALTEEMRDSGGRLDLHKIPGKKVDKHSTGGVGDKTSLLLAPIVAVCGVTVPMITGRALGHTGGTLDKLQAIPGFDALPDPRRIVSMLAKHGAVLMGQTSDLAPADRRLYALRDATGTVESIPLITASILSKKLVEDIDGLVIDLKVGPGAVMTTPRLSRSLARSLADTCKKMRLPCVVLLSRMDQPLGRAVGNALEVRECMEFLNGNAAPDLETLTMALAAQMILLGGRARTEQKASEMAREAVRSGAAKRRFIEIIAAQGGDPHSLEDPTGLPTARNISKLPASRGGFISRADARLIAYACNELGAGRATMEDTIDPAAGVYLHKKVGDRVTRGEALLDIHWNDAKKLRAAMPLLERAFEIVNAPVRRPRIIQSILPR